MTENSGIAKAMLWNSIGNIVYCICQWAITILAVRLDSYGAVGYLSIAMSTTSTFATIAMFSMRNFQVSDIHNEFTDPEYLGSRFMTCTLAMILCFTTAIGSTSTYQMLCIDAFMLIRLAESIVDVIHGIDQKYNRYDLIGISYLIRGVVTVVGFVGGYLIFKEMLIALLITGVLNLGIVFLYDIPMTSKLEKLSMVFLHKNIWKLLKKCIPIVISSYLLSKIPLLPKNALQVMVGNDELGRYSSIASPTLIVQVFATYAFNPMIPKISVLFSEERYDAFLNVFHKILLFFICFAIVICIGGMLVGKLGLTIIYGEDILSSYSFFMPLVFCTIFTAYIWIMNSIVTSIRKTIPMLIAMVIGYGACYLFHTNFIEWFGVNGASYIQILSFAIIFVILIMITEFTVRKKRSLQEEI